MCENIKFWCKSGGLYWVIHISTKLGRRAWDVVRITRPRHRVRNGRDPTEIAEFCGVR